MHITFNKTNLALVACLLALVALPDATYSDSLDIVGSSTVYPFTTVIAERFSQVKGGSTPKVEATGTGGGIKLLCSGAGANYPSIANASRAIKESEIELCAENEVSHPVELKIGYDGIVLASETSVEEFSLTLEQLFNALARELPDASGNLVPNPHTKWSDLGASLPDLEIQIYGPPPTSGTRDALVELAMEVGCEESKAMHSFKSSNEEQFEAACKSIREDGVYIEAGENDNLIIQRLISNPGTFGIVGYSFLEENSDKIKGVLIDDIEPSFESIEDESYPLARSLFIYIKKEHVALDKRLVEFVDFYMSEAMLGEEGELADRGLVPIPADEMAVIKDKVLANLQGQ